MTDAHPRPAKAIRIGRQPDNNIALAGDLDVSRHHAELHRYPDGSIEIIDLGTHHGTYVDGQRITRTMLTEQDIISIGHARFRLSDGELRQYADESAMTIADRLALIVHVSEALLLIVVLPGLGHGVWLPCACGRIALARIYVVRFWLGSARRSSRTQIGQFSTPGYEPGLLVAARQDVAAIVPFLRPVPGQAGAHGPEGRS